MWSFMENIYKTGNSGLIYEYLEFYTEQATPQISLRLYDRTSEYPLLLDWDDGNGENEYLSPHNNTETIIYLTKNYGNAVPRTIRVGIPKGYRNLQGLLGAGSATTATNIDRDNLVKLQWLEYLSLNYMRYVGSIDDIPQSVQYFTVKNISSIGDVTTAEVAARLPQLKSIVFDSSISTLTGSIEEFNGNPITDITFRSGTNISGSINGLVTTDIYNFSVQSTNTISGDISVFSGSNISIIRVSGTNTLTGDIASLSTCSQIYIDGSNTLYGDVSSLSPNLYAFSVSGNNTIGGNIENIQFRNAHIFSLFGINTLGGTFDNLNYVGSSIEIFTVHGENTLSGNISNMIPVHGSLSIMGNNTISGNLGEYANFNLPVSYPRSLNLKGYSSVTFVPPPANDFIDISNLTLDPIASGMDTAAVDALLIYLADNKSTALRYLSLSKIQIIGANAPRSAASDTAVSEIEALGFQVITT